MHTRSDNNNPESNSINSEFPSVRSSHFTNERTAVRLEFFTHDDTTHPGTTL